MADASLLIHSLRHGLVHGTTLAEVLAHADSRSDKSVEWLCPDMPVSATILRIPHPKLSLGIHAPANQTLVTVKRVAMAAGVLHNSTAHGLRRRYARDVRQLSNSTRNSMTEVGEAIGHSAATTFRGLTGKYTGENVTRQYHNERAEAQ